MPEKIRRDGLALTLVIACMAAIMFFVAFSSADWVVRELPPHRFGMWLACRDDTEARNCTRTEEAMGLQELWHERDEEACKGKPITCQDSPMSFVFTVRVFDVITLLFVVASIVFYAVCLARYNAWFISMACGFQFFGGLMCLTACLEWGANFHKAAGALRWGFYMNALSGCVMGLNGIIFALLVCSGTCMRAPSNLGIIFRGNADIEHAKHIIKKSSKDDSRSKTV